MKKLNFPTIEKDAQPAQLFTKVTAAIQKRVVKLTEHKSKLGSVQSPTEIQKQLLD